MTQVILNINDDSKLSFVIKLLKQFDFVDIKSSLTRVTKDNNHNIFDSAGIWEDREIDSNDLRKLAWNRIQ
jgi:hypothetical protein